MTFDKDKLNPEIVKELYSVIRLEEAANLRTNKLSDSQMVNRIYTIIKKTVERDEKV